MVTAIRYLWGDPRKGTSDEMSSAFMMLLLDELPEGWTLELANPDEWDDADVDAESEMAD